MAENFRKNQEFIAEMNKIKTERHIQMHNQMREREVALKIAHDRELCLWSGAFYSVFVPCLCAGWKRTGRYFYLAPVIPLTFWVAYQVSSFHLPIGTCLPTHKYYRYLPIWYMKRKSFLAS